jgi:hypothetical protein
MTNEDVIDLYNRVTLGTPVVVLGARSGQLVAQSEARTRQLIRFAVALRPLSGDVAASSPNSSQRGRPHSRARDLSFLSHRFAVMARHLLGSAEWTFGEDDPFNVA